MYADVMTGSMERAIKETDRRRAIQTRYNKQHGITPQTIVKPIKNTIEITTKADDAVKAEDITGEIEKLTGLMRVASAQLDFETAIKMRDRISDLKKLQTKLDRMKK